MKLKFKKSFFKDLEALPPDTREKVHDLVFRQAAEAADHRQIAGARKIRGHERFYRIKMGRYRIGFELRQAELVFFRVLHRKDIHRRFPP